MTLEEKVICETYTGICFTSGEERGEVYRYAEKLMGRPVYTHEFPGLADQLKDRSRPDFIRVCKGELASTADVAPVIHGHWHFFRSCARCSQCENLESMRGYTEDAWKRFSPFCRQCGAKMDE